jgi:choline dehydrogenase-like flavoprotein
MTVNHYDIVIIGTGAGGGTLAYHLANHTDKKILILERGDYLPREKDNWSSEAVFAHSKYKAHEIWKDKNGDEFHPGIHYYVGGNTKVYGSALLRFRERDFEELVHKDGVSPAWPISYHDMAGYYLKAEELYHVHGERGCDPTEPPESHPYKYPPVKHEPRIQKLYDDMKDIGLTPFHLPLGLKLNEQHMYKSPCIKCNTCDGFPCLVKAKADAQVIAIDPIMDKENVTLITNAYVEKLTTDASGKSVEEIHVKRHGETEIYKGDIVVVSCGAINSSALLLRSANDKHPNGLANGSGVVGRHYMCHNNSAMVALSLEPNDTKFQKTLALNDFYFGSDDYDFPLGHIQMLGKSDAQMFKDDAPKFTPTKILDEMAEHALDFWLTTEDLPDPNNRVIVNKDGSISLHYTENNLESHKRLTQKLKSILKHIGCEDKLIPCAFYLGKKIPIAGTAHQCGTIRFGTNPESSALDVNCKAHELDNLYVVDGSFFVSSTSVNPGLTIMANALRIGDHLLKKLQ